MASLSFPKGDLFSSTPVQSPDDSGYIGSGQRRLKSNFNALNSCSPIKESSVKNVSESFLFHHDFYDISPHLKFDDNFDHVNVRNYSLSSVEVNEYSELASVTSNFSSQNEIYKSTPSTSRTKQKLMCFSEVKNRKYNCNGLLADKDIAYKIFECGENNLLDSDKFTSTKNFTSESSIPKKLESNWDYFTNFKQKKTDFIHELNVRNCSLIISHILSYLTPTELCIASCVNKEWNKVILNDSKENARRKKFVMERHLFLNGPLKENRLGMRYGPAREHKEAFSSLTNRYAAEELPLMPKASETKFDVFIKETKTEEKLQKCPSCSYAAKYLDKKHSVCTRCSYKFCSLCLGPIIKSHSCFKAPIPKIIVGSRKSRKNLKRL